MNVENSPPCLTSRDEAQRMLTPDKPIAGDPVAFLRWVTELVVDERFYAEALADRVERGELDPPSFESLACLGEDADALLAELSRLATLARTSESRDAH